MELEVETNRPDIAYDLRAIVKEMLSCATTSIRETSSFMVSLKVGEDDVNAVVDTVISVDIKVPDTLLEKIKANL